MVPVRDKPPQRSEGLGQSPFRSVVSGRPTLPIRRAYIKSDDSAARASARASAGLGRRPSQRMALDQGGTFRPQRCKIRCRGGAAGPGLAGRYRPIWCKTSEAGPLSARRPTLTRRPPDRIARACRTAPSPSPRRPAVVTASGVPRLALHRGPVDRPFGRSGSRRSEPGFTTIDPRGGVLEWILVAW